MMIVCHSGKMDSNSFSLDDTDVWKKISLQVVLTIQMSDA